MREIVKKFNLLPKKSGRIAAIGAIGIVIIIMIAVMLNGKQSKIELKKETFVVEYGETISTDASNYIKADKDVLKETKIVVSSLKYENDNDYPKIATYKAEATYKDEKVSFSIKVEDTTAPEFIDFKEKIEVDREYDGDLVEQFTAEDLSEVTITINTKDVDFSKAGEYKANVTAEDAYKNKTTKEFTIVVGEKSKAEKEAEAKQQEEDAKAQEEVQQNQSSNGTNATTTTPTQPQTTDTSGQSGNGGTTTPPTPSVCTPTWQNLGNSGKGFYSYDEADAWADIETSDKKSKWYLYGWFIGQTSDGCGTMRWSVEFYY